MGDVLEHFNNMGLFRIWASSDFSKKKNFVPIPVFSLENVKIKMKLVVKYAEKFI